jgi:hypothetical protein
VRHSFRVWSVIVATSICVGLGFVETFGDGFAEAKRKSAPAAAGPKRDVNACGCYKDGAGACLCSKKGKCNCPGECEPKGCEEKRQKDMEKENAAETKKAAEADKKQRESGDRDDKPAKPEKKKEPSGVGQ